MKTVLLIGASNKPFRYSNMAMLRLQSAGYRVIPVHPTTVIDTIENTVSHLSFVTEKIHMAVVYIRPELLADDINELVRISPSQVIFNPGTESLILADKLKNNGIYVRNACTLVLLSTNQFDQEERND